MSSRTELNSNSSLSQIFSLKDGRKLGFAEFGDFEGIPILYFHGHKSSRLEPKMYDLNVLQNKCRLIAIDRPGFGLSDFKIGNKLLDWPDDIVELTKNLNIDKFAVLGGSGGGPYVCACAFKIPQRLTACGIVSGLGPIEFGTEGMNKNNRRELSMARKYPKLLEKIYKLQVRFVKKLQGKTIEEIAKTFQKRQGDLPEPDKKLFEDTEKLSLFVELMSEPLRQGINGIVHEAKLFANYWGFDLREISSELPVFLWHGELDNSVPVRMARMVCKSIPNCKGKFFPNEAHLSTAVNHFNEIIETLIS